MRGLAALLVCATGASRHAAADNIFTNGSIVIRDTSTFASLGGTASKRGLYRELGGVLEGDTR